MKLIYTNSYEEALELRDAGYEPIECAFGAYGSVMGDFCMDHHGTESHREGVAIRSIRDHRGAMAGRPWFVVTGTPDADAILSILALSGRLDDLELPDNFAEWVDRHDRNPIGLDLTTSDAGILLLAFNQVSLPRGLAGFQKGLEAMEGLLRNPPDQEAIRKIVGTEKSRQRRAHESVHVVLSSDGIPLDDPQPNGAAERRVVVAEGAVWGFDIWYLYGPVVVSFSARLEKVTIGCPSVEVSESLFGPGGLLAVYPTLGEGWGGREAIGGSPRGEKKTSADARQVAAHIASLLT